MNSSTQLVSASGYDVNNIIFSEPIVGTIPDSKPSISFSRIMISTKNKDGTEGELILPTTELFTFGVGENLNQETGKVNGYVLPLSLYNKNGPSEEEKDFVETCNNIVDTCKKYLIDKRETLGQYELELNDLKKFNPLYYKREKGKIVDGSGPTLYGKLITSKKNGIVTKFYDSVTGESLNPLDLLGTYSFVKAAIKFESIFIGNKISLQIKVYECDIRPSNTGMKRLLKRPESDSRILNKVAEKSIPYSIDDDSGSIVNSDVDDDFEDVKAQVKAPVEVPKVVKKVIKKIAKKE